LAVIVTDADRCRECPFVRAGGVGERWFFSPFTFAEMMMVMMMMMMMLEESIDGPFLPTPLPAPYLVLSCLGLDLPPPLLSSTLLSSVLFCPIPSHPSYTDPIPSIHHCPLSLTYSCNHSLPHLFLVLSLPLSSLSIFLHLISPPFCIYPSTLRSYQQTNKQATFSCNHPNHYQKYNQ